MKFFIATFLTDELHGKDLKDIKEFCKTSFPLRYKRHRITLNNYF